MVIYFFGFSFSALWAAMDCTYFSLMKIKVHFFHGKKTTKTIDRTQNEILDYQENGFKTQLL